MFRLSPSSLPRWLACLLPGLLMPLGAALPKEPPASPATITSRMTDDLLQMNEFFDTMLPGTLSKYNVILNFTPKFSDVRDREYVRYPFELRYGLSERWELFGGLTPFHPNPINSGHDHRWGPGEERLGVRYNLGQLFGFYDEITLGFETRSPLGEPPLELIDSYSHLRPFVTAARKLGWWPDTSFYTNYSYDREVDTPGRTAPPPGVSKMHILEVAPGFLYKPGEFGAFIEYRYRHIAEERGNQLAHDAKIGGIWDVPLARSQRWKLPGKFQVELAYKFSHEEGLPTDHGFAARVSWRTSLREVLGREPKPAPAK